MADSDRKRLPPDERPSRSGKKRESTALQQKGAELAALSPAVWEKLPLSPDLREALHIWRGLKTWEAKRRHMQFIGRLMRELEEPEELFAALEAIGTSSRKAAQDLHRIEELRDRLLRENPEERKKALEDALAAHPALERGRLAHLMEAAAAEREKQKPPRQARALFRYLRDTLLP